MKKLLYILTALLTAAALFFTCGLNDEETPYLVRVVTAPGDGSPEMGGMLCEPGQQLTLYAVVYSEAGEVMEDASVIWSLSGDIGSLSATSGESTVFTADSVRAPADLEAVADIGHVDLTWTDSANVTHNADSIAVGSYRVWQDDGSGFTVGAEAAGTTGVAAYGVSAGTEYTFYVTANLKGKVIATASSGEEDVTGDIYVTSDTSAHVSKAPLKGSTARIRLYANMSDTVLSAILFSTGARVSADTLDSLDADIYLDNTAGLALMSVSRLDSSYRSSLILEAGPATFDSVGLGILDAPAAPDGYTDSAAVTEGNAYFVYTADNNYAVLKVDAVDSTGNNEYIDILYGWQGLTDDPAFKAAR